MAARNLVVVFVIICILGASTLSFGRVSLRFMMFPDNEADRAWYLAAVEEFEATHPDIDIILEEVPWNNFEEKLLPQILASTPPDIARISCQWGAKYAEMGALADLSAFVTDELKSSYLPSRWVTIEYNGKPFGLPETTIVMGLWYNKTLLDQIGIVPPGPADSPEEAWTWNQFAEIARQVQLQTGVDYGLSLYKSWFSYLTWIYAGGGSLFKEDLVTPAITEPKSVAAIEWLASLHLQGLAPVTVAASADPDAGASLFMAGKSAFHAEGVWRTASFAANIKGFEFGVTYIPYRQGEAPATNVGGENLIIFDACRNKAAAFEFISWITNRENTEEHLAQALLISPRVDAKPLYPIRPDVMEVFTKQAQVYQKHWAKESNTPLFSKITPLFMEQMTLALTGKKTAAEAANAIAAGIEEELK